MSKHTLKIDAHLHVNFKNLNPRSIINYLDKNNLDACWLLSWEEYFPYPPTYIHLPIEEIFEFYSRYPDRIIPMYAPDPTDPAYPQNIDKWIKMGIRGIGELKVRLKWTSSHLFKLLAIASIYQLPVVFHMENGTEVLNTPRNLSEKYIFRCIRSNKFNEYPRKIINRISTYNRTIRKIRERERYHLIGYLEDLQALEQRLLEFPKVNFIGHGPLFWKGISGNESDPVYSTHPVVANGRLLKLLENDNLYADLSGLSGFRALSRDLKFSKWFIDRFQDKLLFGTDNFDLGLSELLLKLKLPTEVLQKVMGSNAQQLIQKKIC